MLSLCFLTSAVNNHRGSDMPIELLVPIIIFSLGVVVAISLSSAGIERIVEGSKAIGKPLREAEQLVVIKIASESVRHMPGIFFCSAAYAGRVLLCHPHCLFCVRQSLIFYPNAI